MPSDAAVFGSPGIERVFTVFEEVVRVGRCNSAFGEEARRKEGELGIPGVL